MARVAAPRSSGAATPALWPSPHPRLSRAAAVIRNTLVAPRLHRSWGHVRVGGRGGTRGTPVPRRTGLRSGRRCRRCRAWGHPGQSPGDLPWSMFAPDGAFVEPLAAAVLVPLRRVPVGRGAKGGAPEEIQDRLSSEARGQRSSREGTSACAVARASTAPCETFLRARGLASFSSQNQPESGTRS